MGRDSWIATKSPDASCQTKADVLTLEQALLPSSLLYALTESAWMEKPMETKSNWSRGKPAKYPLGTEKKENGFPDIRRIGRSTAVKASTSGEGWGEATGA